MRICAQNPAKCPSLLLFTYIIYQYTQTFVTTLIKLFTIYYMMKSWKPNSTVTIDERVNCVQRTELDY